MNKLRKSFAENLLGEKVDVDYRRQVQGTRQKAMEECNIFGSSEDAQAKNRQGNAVSAEIPGVKIVKSACFSCNMGCEILVFVDEKSGEILKVEGDPESPVTKGALCAKGLAAKDLVYNPNRLRHPLKRVGKRGEGKWEEISWDEALSITAEKLLSYRENYGPQGVALLEGTRRGWSRVYTRLANLFHAVNHGAAGWAQCLWPKLVDDTVTFGAQYMEPCDFQNTNCVLCWGVNPVTSWPIRAADIMDARQKGAALIVVDPYFSETAAKADLWLQIQPDTDMALALSMIHVIIKKNLIDSEFIDRWTTGFDKIKEHVECYTPEWAEKITKVPAELIIKAAEMYAQSKPACIVRGVAIEQLHDSVQVCRATSIMASITGNVGIKGGNTLVSARGDISQNTAEFTKSKLIPKELLPLRRGYDKYPLLCGELSPVPSAHMPTLWETIATGEPYPIKAAMIFGSNALVSYTNSNRVWEAVEKLEFLAVCDLFMTPTAEMADIVLPASSWLERDNVFSSFQTSNTCTIIQQKVIELPEAKSDVEIIGALAEKLGLGEYFWKDPKELYDYLLSPTGLTHEEAKYKRRLYAPLTYKRYEKEGFKTPSGKIELYSSLMEKNGCAPMPTYTESFESVTSTPELAQKYPYTLTTGRRVQSFRHSENRQNPILRELTPNNSVYIHPDTAKKLGIADGDKVEIETTSGRAIGHATLTLGISPDVIQTSPGWWGEQNINQVTVWRGKYAEGIGTVCCRGLLCKIKPVDGEGR